MRFHSDPTPSPWLNKRDQRRLLLLVFSLMAVLYVVNLARKPEFWKAMFPRDAADVPRQAESESTHERADVKTGSPNSPGDDEILSPMSSPTSGLTEPGQHGSRPESTSTVARPREPAEILSPQPETVDADLLSEVRDDTLGVRQSEASAWHRLLADVRAADPAKLQRTARSDLPWAVVMNNPEQFRGTPIEIRGKLRRITPFVARRNSFGVQGLYDAWLFTRDSGDRPWHVVTSSVAVGIPIAEKLDESVPVRVCGYFFKREGYAAHGGLRTAPLIAGQRVELVRTMPLNRSDSEIVPWLYAFAIVVGGSLLLTMWRFFVSDRRFRFSRASRLMASPAEVDFDGLEAADIHDLLEELAASSPANGNDP